MNESREGTYKRIIESFPPQNDDEQKEDLSNGWNRPSSSDDHKTSKTFLHIDSF